MALSFKWIKGYMPRSLYGRAALILVLPVVTLQLVVSVVFIQRHFEGVTEQLSRETARSVNLLAGTPELDDLGRSLGMTWSTQPAGALPEANQRRFYDLTGIVVIRSLFDHVPSLLRVALPDDSEVVLYLDRGDEVLRLVLDRGRVSASNPHQLLVNMVFFGALMTVIAFVYMRNQLRPITRLAEAAEAFGKGQVVPYKPSGAVEVRAAGHAFLDMRDRIERQIEQRTMMLSGVSHDLRTPLTRLKLALSMQPETTEAEAMLRDVADMERLIDAFLDFARGAAAETEPEQVDPIRLVRDIVENAARVGQSVDLGPLAGAGMARLRPMAVARAVENLVSNALRYGNRARVSVALEPTRLRIVVEDDGPGIPPERREEAMRPFIRLDAARNQDRGSGAGLGLAIAADVARGHGGRLNLGQSRDLGGLRAELELAR